MCVFAKQVSHIIHKVNEEADNAHETEESLIIHQKLDDTKM